MLPIVEAPRRTAACRRAIDAAVAADWLVAFLRDELIVRRGIPRAVIGLSGGVDSAVTAYLCARALGPENVYAIRMPYRTSSASSLADAQLVVDALGIHERDDRHQRRRSTATCSSNRTPTRAGAAT